VCAITNIGFDHTQFLGNTLKAIAAEKAGIIKSEIPVVIGETQNETMFVFMEKAQQMNAPISFADRHQIVYFDDKNKLNIDELGKRVFSNINFPLLGKYQEKNVVTVMEIIFALKKKDYKIEPQHIINGLENVIKNTGFCGRWQILNEKPLTICDAAHNENGLSEVIKQIKTVSYRKLHIVLGMVNDKDIFKMLSMMPKDAEYYFCKADIPRGLEATLLQK
jgi:dihydrofolate synthase/folylpolyglutamate synthase